METKTIQGKVKFLKNNEGGGYAVKIDDVDWFNAFAGKCPVKAEDYVELKYTEKESEGRIFKNIRSIEEIEKPQVPIQNEKVKSFEGLSINDLAIEINKLPTMATQVFRREDGKYDSLCYLKN